MMIPDALTAVTTVAGALSFVTGCLLFCLPRHVVVAAEQAPGAWPARVFHASMDQRITLERWFYRNHRIAGCVVVAGAAASLLLLWWLQDDASGRLRASLSIPPVVMVAWWAAAWIALWIGVVVYVRPSALKRIEELTNRWVEPFPVRSNQSGRRSNGVSRFIAGSPRIVGTLLICAGVFCWIAVGAGGWLT